MATPTAAPAPHSATATVDELGPPGTGPYPARQRPGARRLGWVVVTLLLSLVGLAAVSEALGWPFLRQPLQRFLTQTLQRDVSFATPDGADLPDQAFAVHLLGGLELRVANLRVAAPAWSTAPHLLQAQGVVLDMRYADLWAAHRGEPVRLRRLQAAGLDAQLERLADGRASWQFGNPDQAHTTPAPVVGNLQVANGALRYRDEPRAIDLVVKLSLTDGPPPQAGAPLQAQAASAQDLARAPAPPLTPAVSGGSPTSQSTPAAQLLTLRAHAGGRYRDLPLQVALTTSGALPWVADEAANSPQKAPLTLSATVGQATLAFDGTAVDLRHLRSLSGQFTLTGPSLAAVGDPVGVTLPTTAAFRAQGWVVKDGDIWKVVADEATVGSSRLHGAFTYDRARAKPLLAGRLGGSRLLLADLGPAIGGAPHPGRAASASAVTVSAPAPAAPVSQAPSSNSLVKGPPPKRVKAPGKVLPDRPFDLAALNRMDADVLVQIGELDLNTAVLEPLRPVRTHLRLMDGVLTLSDLDAHTAQGRLQGLVRLDGRAPQALWRADLRVSNVRLEQWLHLQRAKPDTPPYITGVLHGRANVTGTGRSTADMLATLNGQVHAELSGGSISHLLVEMAGLDVAQGLGMLVKGDDALPVTCGVTDLVARDGQLRPRVMVIDTRDSAIWVDGTLSLAQESMDLRAVVSPKDFSPLSLRTPVLVQGTFSDPQVSVQKAPLTRKLGSAVLLGLLNPLAALLPLMDPGDRQGAAQDTQGCQALARRGAALARR